MQTLQPQHPDQYRALPAPPQMYAPPYQQQMPYPPAQPAPRQRTAIACRYCRRRKVCDASICVCDASISTNGRFHRFAARATTKTRKAAAPTASASRRSASSLPSVHRPRPSSPPTRSGAVRTRRRTRSSTAPTASHCRNTAVAISTHHHSSSPGSTNRHQATPSNPCISNLRRRRSSNSSSSRHRPAFRRFRVRHPKPGANVPMMSRIRRRCRRRIRPNSSAVPDRRSITTLTRWPWD